MATQALGGSGIAAKSQGLLGLKPQGLKGLKAARQRLANLYVSMHLGLSRLFWEKLGIRSLCCQEMVAARF